MSVAPIEEAVNHRIETHTQISGGDLLEEYLTIETVNVGNGAVARLDLVAAEFFGNPAYWRLVAEFAGMDDPLEPPPNGTVVVPIGSNLGRIAG